MQGQPRRMTIHGVRQRPASMTPGEGSSHADATMVVHANFRSGLIHHTQWSSKNSYASCGTTRSVSTKNRRKECTPAT
jgi:hypothetical protein